MNYWKSLISAIGAGILGFGLGVYFFEAFQSYALWIVIAGALTHGASMMMMKTDR